MEVDKQTTSYLVTFHVPPLFHPTVTHDPLDRKSKPETLSTK